MHVLRDEDSVQVTEDWLQSRIKLYGAESIFLPAGETPKRLYARWREHPPTYLKNLRLLQVDDVADGPGKGLFARFFRQELPHMQVIEPKVEQPCDLAILGLGPNGHLAFHEPGVPTGFTFGVVDLAEDTLHRLSLPKGTKGITYGVGAFIKTKAILLIVKGPNKKEAWHRLQQEDPTLPASGILAHPDVSIWTDFT